VPVRWELAGEGDKYQERISNNNIKYEERRRQGEPEVVRMEG
jgi:hypothetical protein